MRLLGQKASSSARSMGRVWPFGPIEARAHQQRGVVDDVLCVIGGSRSDRFPPPSTGDGGGVAAAAALALALVTAWSVVAAATTPQESTPPRAPPSPTRSRRRAAVCRSRAGRRAPRPTRPRVA